MTVTGNDTSRAAPATGILCALGATFLFSLNDVTIKFLSGDYALHQVVLIRSLIALCLLMAVFVPFQGGLSGLRTRRLGMHVIRGLCVVTANMCFFAALAAMPLAEAVAIFFVSPLLITVFSVVFLHETVGPRRWVAVAIGLLGVLVMVRPGTEAFRPIALLPLLSATAYAMLHILTRKIGGTERATTMAVYIQLMFILVSGVMGIAFGDGALAGGGNASVEFLLRDWVWPAAGDWWLLLLLGLANGGAGVLISQAYRLGEAALVAPFEYVAMPMAVFWGITVFGEWPDGYTAGGIALIIGGGLYMLLRETRLRKLPERPRARR